MNIFIIGGAGRMGKWFAEFCASQGHSVSIYDTKGRAKGYAFEPDMRRGCENADMVLLATPLGATNAIYKKLLKYKTKAVIIDICSLKSPIIKTIKSGIASGRRIASIHPMFGPETELLTDSNVIICDCGDKSAVKAARSLFSGTNANLVNIKLDDHDKFMSYVLGLSHLSNILFFGALKGSGIKFDTLKSVGGTTFNAQAEVARRVAEDNAELYFEIQSMNAHTKKLYATVKKTLSQIDESVASGDMDKFIKIIEHGRRYFKSVKTKR